MSELPIEGGVLLPSDVPTVCDSPGADVVRTRGSDDPTAGGHLHWAPVGAASSTRRLRVLVDHLDDLRPDGVVVDVSVETLLACRLAGVPTIAVRQHGDRSDPAHRLGYATARRLIAPFPVELDDSRDEELLARTTHVGFVRPTDASTPTPGSRVDRAGLRDVGPDDVVVLWGRGGGHLSGRSIDAVADAVTGRVVCVGTGIWADGDGPSSERVVDLGWIDDPDSLLAGRPVVIASCGNNVVAAVAATGCPYVAVPQDRPFDEQRVLADALVRCGVASLRPDADDAGAWADAISAARRRRDRWSVFADRFDGATVAAETILRTFA